MTLSSGGFKLYIDGVIVASNLAVKSAQSRNGYWRIGGYVYNGTTPVTATFDDIGFWNRALSDQEVQAIYNYK